jgi:septal ring factor EnvC (AmiA/AmiB activator)
MKPHSIPTKIKSGSGSVSTKDSADGSETIPDVAPAVARKRYIDETLLSPDDAEKLLERRAYNRECASRARKRSKQLIAQLEAQVKELQEDKDELRKRLLKMEQQCILLEDRNQAMILQQMLMCNNRGTLNIPSISSSLPFAQGDAMKNGIVAPDLMLSQYRFA